MAGRATFTMEMSSTTMNWARHTTTRTAVSDDRGPAAGTVAAGPVSAVGDSGMGRA
jgi:hypothetical protein